MTEAAEHTSVTLVDRKSFFFWLRLLHAEFAPNALSETCWAGMLLAQTCILECFAYKHGLNMQNIS
jgi:hypothetical protein